MRCVGVSKHQFECLAPDYMHLKIDSESIKAVGFMRSLMSRSGHVPKLSLWRPDTWRYCTLKKKKNLQELSLHCVFLNTMVW